MRCQSNPSFLVKSVFFFPLHCFLPSFDAGMDGGRSVTYFNIDYNGFHLLRQHVSLTVWANDAAYACVPGAAESSVASWGARRGAGHRKVN